MVFKGRCISTDMMMKEDGAVWNLEYLLTKCEVGRMPVGEGP